MQKLLQNGRKHLEKEKLLIMSNFSFSHSVFKTLVLQTLKIQGLFGKGLKQFAKLCETQNSCSNHTVLTTLTPWQKTKLEKNIGNQHNS